MFLSSANSSKVTNMSSKSCMHQCLRHSLSFCVSLLLLVLLVNATPHFLDETELDDQAFTGPDKRPARLSYFRAPYGGGGVYVRGRYNPYASHGYGSHSNGGGNRKNDWWRKKAVNRHSMPWENLPNTNCLRKFCRSDNECCRRYSKCNEEARVCYDCWYGHPCSTNTDCCERYPVCNPVLRSCGK